MEEARIDQIRDNLHQITLSEFKINKYVVEEKEEVKKEPKPVKETSMELNMMKGTINKEIRKKEYKIRLKPSENLEDDLKDKPVYQPTKPVNTMELEAMSNEFNVVVDENELPTWRQLSTDDKLEILENYFVATDDKFPVPYTGEIKDEIRDLVRNNKLLYKKEIEYDKINKKITNIPLIKYEDEKFFLKIDVKKVSIKTRNMKSINKLIKKN